MSHVRVLESRTFAASAPEIHLNLFILQEEKRVGYEIQHVGNGNWEIELNMWEYLITVYCPLITISSVFSSNLLQSFQGTHV